MNRKRLMKKSIAFAAAVCVALTGFTLMPQKAEAATAETVTISIVNKDGESETVLEEWTYNADNKTYTANGEELKIVKDFTDDENLKGAINGQSYDFTSIGALPYSGINKKPDPRCLSVTTKGILLEDLYDYAESLATMKLRGDTLLCLSDASGFKDVFTYNQYWGLNRYYYPEWYSAESYSESEMGETELYVPTTLAILGYHGTVGAELSSLISKADAENALRISSGMQKDGNKTIEAVEGTTSTTDINEGMLSVKSISIIRFTPTYLDITVDESIANATVTTDDGYYTAAYGEEVVLTVTPDDGYEVSEVSVKESEADVSVDVTAEDDSYTFTMPEEAVTVSVSTEEVPPVEEHVYGENGFCLDCGVYNPEADNYYVTEAKELHAIAEAVNSGDSLKDKTVYLTDKTDLSEYAEWTPIGNAENPFEGTFDGQGNEITSLTITNAANGYSGLFGYSKGTVENFSISGSIGSENAYITSGKDNIGGAVGWNDGIVSGIKGNVEIFVNSGIYAVGGIVGQNGDDGIVKECLNEADIFASKASGGIVGRNYGEITTCKNTGDISGNQGGKDGIGGIAGYGGNKNSTYQNSITYCYNTGTITNKNGRWHGGIAGFADSATTVTNCYAVGEITPGYSWNWNAVIGHVDSAYKTVHDNYSLDTIANGDSNADTMPLTIGTQKTEAELMTEAFVSEINGDEENFLYNEGGFPILYWEKEAKYIDEATITAVDQVYTGKTVKTTVTVKDGDKKLVEGKDFEVLYDEDDDFVTPGPKSAQVIGLGDYTGSAWAEYMVLFKDVTNPKDFWYPYVYWMAEQGITKGWDDGTFRPMNNINRAAVVTFIWRYEGCPKPKSIAKFSDMPANTAANQDFINAISWAYEKGITTGFSDGTFRPWDECNRAAIVTFLWRNAKKPTPKSTAKFSDMTGNSDFDKAISWAAENKITTGWDDNTFRPWNQCKRLAVASFMARLDEIL